MKRWWHRVRADTRGGTDVAAMMFIIPVAFGAVMLFVFFGRQGSAAEGVTHAAHVAARAASLERSAGAAESAAHGAAAATLSAAGPACAGGPEVSVEADAWAPGGIVAVTVSCSVATGDLGAIDARARTFTGRARAVIDTYRGYEGP